MNQGPLAGIRIIEVGHMLAGPYCGMLLADLGAEVIKVEAGDGDISRETGGQWIGPHNVYFASLNRNKKSVKLDLTDEVGLKQFHELARSARGLITNLRPSAIRKLGLTYDALQLVNDRIVCVALTGFGLTGPYSELPAYDYIIQAMAGVMMLTGEPDSPPVRAGYSVVDNTGGMMAAIGMMAKLIEGKGGQVDVALYDTLLSQLNYLGGLYLNSGQIPERQPSGGHSFFVPAQIFKTSDGYVAIFITHDVFWKKFAAEVGRSDWLQDERFATMTARSRNREVVVAEIQHELAKRTSNEWLSRLQKCGIVIAAVGTLADALGSDQTAVRRMVVEIPTGDGLLRLIGNPIKLEGYEGTYALPPLLDEHHHIMGASNE